MPVTFCSSMQAAGKEQEFLDLLSQTESAKLEGGALDTACTALQELVSSVVLKDKVLEQACEHALLVTETIWRYVIVYGYTGLRILPHLKSVAYQHSGIWCD